MDGCPGYAEVSFFNRVAAMTPDTVRGLPAGPEIDSQVACALGWSPAGGAYALPADGGAESGGSVAVGDFRPSADWRWAMLAVECWARALPDDASFVLHYDGPVRDETGPVLEPARWFAFFPGPTEAEAPTGPLAVCRSLLLAALHRTSQAPT